MRKYLESIVVLWRAPAAVRDRAEEEMKSELDALPPVLRDKANRACGKKEWKIALAAKVKSVLAQEESEHLHDRLKPGLESGADPAASVGAVLRANDAALKAELLRMTFRNEWGTFIHSLTE